ncbi:MAG: SCO family protein [Thiotrichales bacterium]|nr:MAG: SCO family protein [Thiotrichales bacterium]
MTRNKKFPIGTLILFGLFLLVMLITYILVRPPPPPPELEGVLRPEFRLLRSFELTDHEGAVFDQKRFQGKWTFVFFGYTSCPDICPATLYVLNAVQGLIEDKTGEAPEEMQVIFISVDPKRDTPELLADYVAHFNKTFIGATAGKQEIDRVAGQFGAGYVLEEETAPGSYLVSHTSAIFLVDPLGRLVATFSQPHYASTIVTLYEKILAYFYQ